MLRCAQAASVGENIDGEPDFLTAHDWYTKAIAEIRLTEKIAEGVAPLHTVLASMAALLQTGGKGLARDADRAAALYEEAAEEAMEASDGKRADRYYKLAATCGDEQVSPDKDVEPSISEAEKVAAEKAKVDAAAKAKTAEAALNLARQQLPEGHVIQVTQDDLPDEEDAEIGDAWVPGADDY
eukprot:SAG31_NODE_2198_length_6212_cov_3.843096_4_plen_183_part_00